MARRVVLGMPVLATLRTRTSVNGRMLILLFLPNTILWSIQIPTSIIFSYILTAQKMTVTGRRKGTGGGTETKTEPVEGNGRRRGNQVRHFTSNLRIEGTVRLPVPLLAHPLVGRLLTVLRTLVAPLSEGGLLPSQHLQTNLKGYEKITSIAPRSSLPLAEIPPLRCHVVHPVVLGTKAEIGGELTCPAERPLPEAMS